MKYFLLLITLLVSHSIDSQPQKEFQKSVSIDEYFNVRKFEKSEHYEKLKVFSIEVTERVANKFISYQQEYDFKFYRNYKNKTKMASELVIGSRIVDRNQKNFEDDFWFYNNHLKADFFFELIETDTFSNIPYNSFSIPFTVDDLTNGKVYKEIAKRLPDFVESMVSYSYYITSQRLNPANRVSDSLVFTIETIFESKNKLPEDYTRKLTDLANNAIISEQIVKRDEKGKTNHQFFTFRYYQNYLKKPAKKRPSELYFFGNLTYDSAMRYYYLDIDLMIEGEIMQVPKEFDRRMAFNEQEMYSYSKVAQPIRSRISTLLFVFYELYIKEILEEE